MKIRWGNDRYLILFLNRSHHVNEIEMINLCIEKLESIACMFKNGDKQLK